MNQQITPSVVLVDEQDCLVGLCEKIEAHKKNLRHSAFSIFLFRIYNSSLQLLMQQRSPKKYHSGGLWSNSCCSHLIIGKSLKECAHGRLQEEIGVEAEVSHLGWFHYQCQVSDGLFENENDHLFIGTVKNQDTINKDEVAEIRWFDWHEVKGLAAMDSKTITPWLKPAIQHLSQFISDNEIQQFVLKNQEDAP